MTRRLATLLVAIMVALTAGLAGCSAPTGADDGAVPTPDAGPVAAYPSASPATGSHNDADVRFASAMVPHGLQTVGMAEVVLAKPGLDPRVTDLASRVRSSRARETGELSGWLTGWGQDPAGSADDSHHGSGPGSIGRAVLVALQRSSGERASELFLGDLISHDRAASTLATTELAEGQNPDATALAREVVSSRQREITELQRLLRG